MLAADAAAGTFHTPRGHGQVTLVLLSPVSLRTLPVVRMTSNSTPSGSIEEATPFLAARLVVGKKRVVLGTYGVVQAFGLGLAHAAAGWATPCFVVTA